MHLSITESEARYHGLVLQEQGSLTHIHVANPANSNNPLANKAFCLVACAEVKGSDNDVRTVRHIRPLLSTPFKVGSLLYLSITLSDCGTQSDHKRLCPKTVDASQTEETTSFQ